MRLLGFNYLFLTILHVLLIDEKNILIDCKLLLIFGKIGKLCRQN